MTLEEIFKDINEALDAAHPNGYENYPGANKLRLEIAALCEAHCMAGAPDKKGLSSVLTTLAEMCALFIVHSGTADPARGLTILHESIDSFVSAHALEYLTRSSEKRKQSDAVQ